MIRKRKHEFIDAFNVNLFDCKLLGRGHNGAVYLLPDGRAMKIFHILKDFSDEVYILRRVNGNKYFPKIYDAGENFLVRDCVEGKSLTSYIKKNGMDRELTLKLIDLLKEFKKLRFKKIDIRCKDIFIQPDKNLKVIDPQKFYSKSRNFPRHLSKGLYKLGVLDTFLKILEEENRKLYKKWAPKIKKYIDENYKNIENEEE